MKNIIKKISGAVQLVLMAPIKLPAKALQVLKYVALGLGIVERVLEKEDDSEGEPVPNSLRDDKVTIDQ